MLSGCGPCAGSSVRPCDAIAKMIPGDLGMTLEKALKQSPDLREAYQNDDEVQYLIDMSLRLEGTAETYLHACGRRCDRPAGH